jgi:hypothetical protein
VDEGLDRQDTSLFVREGSQGFLTACIYCRVIVVEGSSSVASLSSSVSSLLVRLVQVRGPRLLFLLAACSCSLNASLAGEAAVGLVAASSP